MVEHEFALSKDMVASARLFLRFSDIEGPKGKRSLKEGRLFTAFWQRFLREEETRVFLLFMGGKTRNAPR